MTACVIDSAETLSERVTQPGCAITADGAYAARLARAEGSPDAWFPERWTLDGPEPYAVPLPGSRPEEPGTEVLPLSDGRVLIHRIAADRHMFALLYPAGPGTGELPLGAIERLDEATGLRLLPPAPDGSRAYALSVGPRSSTVWLVAGGAFGPEMLAEVPGRCSGGVWLDRTGRLLALDQRVRGRTKTVAVDLEDGGTVTPLLQLTDDSDDRLLLADPDSGLLVVRSDAPSPGHARLGWGVLGSMLPVRFPECLRLTDCAVRPFAVQPGQLLNPESCAVAFRIDGAAGSRLGLWRPDDRQLHHLPAPEGWLAGAGFWTHEGVLHLPYVTGAVPCGVVRVEAPTGAGDPGRGRADSATGEAPSKPAEPDPPAPPSAPPPAPPPAPPSAASRPVRAQEPAVRTRRPLAQGPRPVPLQQAPLIGRVGGAREGAGDAREGVGGAQEGAGGTQEGVDDARQPVAAG